MVASLASQDGDWQIGQRLRPGKQAMEIGRHCGSGRGAQRSQSKYGDRSRCLRYRQFRLNSGS